MAALSAVHRHRLREVWRGANWPCHDPVELDLLTGGLLERQWDGAGRESLLITDAGLLALAAARQRNKAALGAHEALVASVTRDMQRAGRVVWRGLALRAGLSQEDGSTRWAVAMPDVFSIRHTTVEQFLEPVIHEIKVSRADLLADLRRPPKAQAYLALASQCWYVVPQGLCQPEEIPPGFGLLFAQGPRLELGRPAPRRQTALGFAQWMALARATAEPVDDEPVQRWLVPEPPTEPAPP